MKIMWYGEYDVTYEWVQAEPCLEFMPMELLVRIFSFLNSSDLMTVALTCKRFLDTMKYRRFTEKWILNFGERYMSQFAVPIHMFIKCSRNFPACILATGLLDDYNTEEYFIQNGEHLTEIQFMSGLLRKEEFVNVIKYCKNLEVFKIEANNMFRSWEIKKFAYERRIYLRKCSHVSLARNNVLTTDVFDYVMETSPNLTSLDLSNCLQLMNPPERNKFLDNVLVLLRERSRHITSLDFSHTITDDLFLDSLGRIDLRLKELHLTFMGSTKNSNYGLPVLIARQPALEKFDLSASPSVNDIVVRMIANNMKNIRILLLKKCHNLTDNGVREIAKLHHLRSLEISDCDYVTDVGIMDGVLSGTPKKDLRELNLSLLKDLGEPVVTRLSYFYENLNVLDLGAVTLAVTDNSLQMILRHMTFLRYLNVDSCCKLTDFGFTGVESEFSRRLHSIRNLKGLQILRCNGLYKLTDFTLVDAFAFRELRELYFARCGFTLEGITALVSNCRSLEVLDLSECKEVDDECVDVITSALPRLKTLKLNRCDKITERCFEILYKNCTELRNIFLRGCKLRFDPADHLMWMSNLRKVVT